MKVFHYREAEPNVFDQHPAKGVTGRVAIGKADGATNFCMRVFELSPGGHTPLHAHDWEHEIFVHSGRGSVFREGEWMEILEGTVMFIPANEEHQIRNSGDVALSFVCLIPSGPPEL